MKKIAVIVSIVFVVLLGILAIGNLDYTISVGLGNENSVIAQFFNWFGEFPSSLALLVGATILFGSRKKEKKANNILGWIFGPLAIVAFGFLMVFMPIQYAFEEAPDGIPTLWLAINAILAIAIAVGAILLTNKHAESCRKFRKTGLFLIVLVLAEMILVNVLKGIWARPRMRSIDDISEFKYWYQIGGWTNDNELKSFPSGHTANAFVLWAFVLLAPAFKRIKAIHIIIVSIVWGALVAWSRVVLGAHFLSDVLVGCFVTLFLFLGLYRLFYKRGFSLKQIQ